MLQTRKKPLRLALPDQVQDIIRARILDREYLPERHLNIDALAREMNVSATPVREALGRLAAEGLVSSQPYIGYAVAAIPSPEHYRQLFAFRKIIEPWAAGEAARRKDKQALQKMRAAIEAMEQTSLSKNYHRFRDFNAADEAFHRAIFEGTGNGPALNVFIDLRIHLHISRLFIRSQDQDSDPTRAQHRAIYASILAADAKAASAAMLAHLEQSEIRILDQGA